MFNKEDILKLRIFLQKIIADPIPMDDQKKITLNGKMWCEEWEIIEILKCLFHGEETYRGDPPPNRLKGNPSYNQENIIEQAQELIKIFGTADEIINHLQKRRDGIRERAKARA